MSYRPRAFVAIATGQAISNVPPILELAREGDIVIWLESAMARRQHWSRGPERLLSARGLRFEKPVPIEQEDPAAMVRQLREAAGRWMGHDPVVVANGGTKLAALALKHAFSATNPLWAYGLDRPVELLTVNGNFDGQMERRAYRHHPLTLEEVVECAGYELLKSGEGERLWPGPRAPAGPYGRNPAATAATHIEWDRWSSRRSGRGGRAEFSRLPELVGLDRYQRWVRSLVPFLAVAGRERTAGVPAERAISRAQEQLKALFASTVSLHEAALAGESVVAQALDRPAQIGPVFEQAVADRVHAWLEQGEASRYVASAYSNARIARDGRVVAELDVALLLRNGIVVNLECKSYRVGDAGRKDLDARLLNLQRTASRIARMAIVAPLYTQFAGEPWFGEMHDMRRTITEKTDFDYLPLTIPGQPAEYSASSTRGDSWTWACPAFEEALEQLLRQYEPTGRENEREERM